MPTGRKANAATGEIEPARRWVLLTAPMKDAVLKDEIGFVPRAIWCDAPGVLHVEDEFGNVGQFSVPGGRDELRQAVRVLSTTTGCEPIYLIE